MTMATANKTRRCGRLEQWLVETVACHMQTPAGWMQRHLATCPRCRKAALRTSRLRTAFLLLKTEAHTGDLLLQANARAIAVLSRRVRDVPKARRLREMRPGPRLRQRLGGHVQSLAHAAACLAALLLLRMGVLTSLTRVHDQGKQVVEQYYARSLDKDMLEDLL